MFSQSVGSNDIDRSKKFYDALFGAMDAPGVQDAGPDSSITARLVSKPIDGKAASHSRQRSASRWPP